MYNLAKVNQWQDIRWDGMEVIGKGGFGVVYGDPEFAVKIGQIGEGAVLATMIAEDEGLGPKVYRYFERIPFDSLPEHLKTAEVASRTYVTAFNGTDYVDILIMERIRGAWWHLIGTEVQGTSSDKVRLVEWADNHPFIGWYDRSDGNWGYTYDGRPVLIDGLHYYG